MLLQFGLEQQINTIATIIAASNPRYEDRPALRSVAELQEKYHSFLERFQNRQPVGRPGTINIVTDLATAETFRQHFVNDSLLDDKQQAEVILQLSTTDLELKRALLQGALQMIGEHAPDYLILIRTLITDIFFLPSRVARAGSSSQALGVIWVDPKPDYPVSDVAEMIVHEFTHHAMFVDEIRYTHFNYDRIIKPETWAVSAILHTPRPLDKVLHSIVVGTEVLLFRQKYLSHPHSPRVHPPTPLLLEQVASSIRSVEDVLGSHADIELLTHRGREILHAAKDAIATLH